MAVQPTYQRLSNGLQSLSDASPDYELAPVGIASMHEQAQRLAEAGRNGDIYVIHAAEGETVIPMEVLAANPQIKQLLFAQMKDMGLDPQEFVVGNELNSINPVTGLPEFFFKSLFRSVKKAVKKVFKFAKKIAPFAIPIAASAFGFPAFMGPMFAKGTFGAAALASGLGSLAGGGSIKDAFKSAIIGGGISTLGSGLVGGFRGEEFGPGFMKGVQESFTGTLPDPSTLGELYGEWGVPDIYGTGTKDVTTSALEKVGGEISIQNPLYQASLQSAQTTSPLNYGGMSSDLLAAPTGDLPANVVQYMQNAPSYLEGQTIPSQIQSPQFLTTVADERNILEKAGDWLSGGGQSPQAIEQAGSDAATKAVKKYLADYGSIIKDRAVLEAAALAAGEAARAAAGPGYLAQYGPTAALGAGAAYAGGMFDPPEEEEEATPEDLSGFVSGPTGFELFEQDKPKYQIPVNPLFGQENILKGQDVFVPSRFAADGGMINGPGTGTSDSIPGWLSDGEFVVTEKGVRGADPTGQGRREAGAANLYNIMRNFEMRA
jgi:hypothetical protein